MGKLSDSLLSGSYGRTGRLVVANVAGTEILRVRPQKRTSPPSAKQLLVQQRMKKCYDFISPYKSFATVYFGVKIGLRSCYNLAMANLLNAFKLDFVAATITPEFNEIEFCKGPLMTAVPTGMTAPAAASFTVEWYNNSAGDPLRETDQLQLLYFAQDESKPIFMENAAARVDTTLSVSVPPNLVGKTVHAWVAFRSLDLESVSVSVYVGSVVIS